MRRFVKPLVVAMSALLMGGSLSSCVTEELARPIEEIVKRPTMGFVTDNTSIYSQGLECLGQLITADGQAWDKGVTIAVGLVQDKTSRNLDSSPLTQAATDIALTALSRLNSVKVVGAASMQDLLQYNVGTNDNNRNKVINEVNIGSLGGLIQSDVFLAGSISEYNKDFNRRSKRFGIFGKIFDLGGGVDDSIINVAIDLRLVRSTNGMILRSAKQKLLAVSLQNNVVTRGYDGNVVLAAANHSLGVHAGFNLRVTDPIHLAIRELIERGVLMLVGELYNVNWQTCVTASEQAPAPVAPVAPKITENGKDSGSLGEF
jgi:curli biogenesis system outer membrane secretion channel CsgG